MRFGGGPDELDDGGAGHQGPAGHPVFVQDPVGALAQLAAEDAVPLPFGARGEHRVLEGRQSSPSASVAAVVRERVASLTAMPPSVQASKPSETVRRPAAVRHCAKASRKALALQ